MFLHRPLMSLQGIELALRQVQRMCQQPIHLETGFLETITPLLPMLVHLVLRIVLSTLDINQTVLRHLFQSTQTLEQVQDGLHQMGQRQLHTLDHIPEQLLAQILQGF